MSQGSKQDEAFGMHDLTMQTLANNRRSRARGQMLQAHSENLDLLRSNQRLKEQVAELQALLNALSALTRKCMVRSGAMKKTVQHLRATWKAEGPESSCWKTTDAAIGAFFTAAYDEILADPAQSSYIQSEIHGVLRRAREDLQR